MVRWLFSTNAKDIGVLYLIFALFAGMVGTTFSALIRLELASPTVQFLLREPQLYNVFVTALFFVMILFLLVIPVLIGKNPPILLLASLSSNPAGQRHTL
jgi:cytochrome c oxidase subunit 1